MGENTTIDSLQIEIQTNSTNAARGIDSLAASLEKLKKNSSFKAVSTNLNHLSNALSGLPNVHNASNSLRTLANSIEKLKGVGTVSSLSNSLKKLPDALKSLESINLGNAETNVRGLVDAISPLTQVKNSGFSSMVNAMAKLKKVTESLDTETLDRFAEKVKKLNEIVEPFATKMGTIKSALSGINTQIKQTNVSIDKVNEEVHVSIFNISNMMNVLSQVHGMLQNIITALADVIHQATEWDGISARFGRGFGAEAQETYEWVKRLNEEMGINIQQFMQYSSVYATMLTGFGVANQDATKMALGYTELTYDIWAGYNDIYKTFDEAAEAVRSAIAGEVEPVRRAGFTIIESTLQQTAANHGLEISIENATEAQKSYLRYLTLVDQAHSQGLVGTYAKEMNTAEGLLRTLSQQFKSLTQAFGSLFIPLLVKALPWVQAFVELLTEGVYWLANLLGVEIQKVDFSGYDAGAGAIENVANSAGTASDALGDATKAAKELKNATLGIDELNVISPNSASSGAGGSGGSGVGGGGNGFAGLDVDSLWDETIFDTIQSDVDAIKEKLRGWMPVIASVAAGLAGLRLVKLLDDIKAIEKVKGLGSAFSAIVEFIKAAKQNAPEVGWFSALFPKLSTWLSGLPAALSSAIPALSAAGPYVAIAAAVVGGIVLAFVDYDFTEIGHTIGKKIGEAIRGAVGFIWNGAKSAFNWLLDALEIDSFWDAWLLMIFPPLAIVRITPEITEFFKTISDWINEKIENLKGNINEFFSGFFDGLFEGLGIDMSWADKFKEFIDIEYMDIVEMIANPLSIGKFIVEGIWKGISDVPFVKKFTDWCSNVVEKIKDFFGIHSPSTVFAEIGGNLIAGLISPFKADTIKNKLATMWSNAKSWWDNKKSALKSYTPSIGSIYDKLKSRWDSARTWWNDKKSKMKEYTPSIGSIYEKVYARWKNARDWWNSKKGSFKTYTPSIGSLTDKLKSAWNSAKKWWNNNVKLSTKLDIKVPKIEVKWDTASAFGKSFRYPTGFKLKFAADGGIFDQGSLIWAGERGPEVMATAAGGKTGVMNVEQMQEAVYEGVYAAMIAAMRGMSGGGNQSVNVYLDSKQITAAVEQRQRERGASIMGNEVYSY